MRYVNCIVVLCVLFFFIPMAALAGSLDDPGAPTSAASAMYTLADIYNRLNDGTAGAKRTGAFTEPSSGPAGTGYTTDEIMDKAPSVDDLHGAGAADVASGKTFWGLKTGEWGLKTGTGAIATDPAPVAKTGQTQTVPESPAIDGSDGNLQKGVAWPNPRFSDNGDGTVTDNLTGLIWLQDADCMPQAAWGDSTGPDRTFALISQLNEGMDFNCDNYTYGTFNDWRLPNISELLSLIDWAFGSPALSDDAGTGKWTGATGSSFTGVQSSFYWSSSVSANNTASAWNVGLADGRVSYDNKDINAYVWPVRGGQ